MKEVNILKAIERERLKLPYRVQGEEMIKLLRSFVLGLFGIIVSVATTVCVMIYGWGLSPKSWWWIIGMYLIGIIVALTIIELAKQKD